MATDNGNVYTEAQVKEIVTSLVSDHSKPKHANRPHRFWKWMKFFSFIGGMFVNWEERKLRKGIWLDALLLFVIFVIFRVGIFMIKEMDAGRVVDLKVLIVFISAIGTLAMQLISIQKANNTSTSTMSSIPGMNSMMPGSIGNPATNLVNSALSMVDTRLTRVSPSSPVINPTVTVNQKVLAGDNR